MKKCLTCDQLIPGTLQLPDGSKMQLYKRKRCLKCSPLNKKRQISLVLKPLTKAEEIAIAQNQQKTCTKCSKEKTGTDFYHDQQSGKLRPYCKKCNLIEGKKSQTKWKEVLVSENGGGCKLCGYNRCIKALVFHHLDPTQKEFGISELKGGNIAAARKEALKCVLLCNRCHTEVHDGMATIVLK